MRNTTLMITANARATIPATIPPLAADVRPLSGVTEMVGSAGGADDQCAGMVLDISVTGVGLVTSSWSVILAVHVKQKQGYLNRSILDSLMY